MNAAEILRAAKAKIADPAHWCQDEEALNEVGEGTFAESEYACQWCALGAPVTVTGNFRELQAANWYLNEMAEQMGYERAGLTLPAAVLNDTTDNATLMELYSLAFPLAEKATTR